MERTFITLARILVVAFVAGLGLAIAASGQGTPIGIPPQPVDLCPTAPGPLYQNRDGYFVNFEEGPVHPLEASWDGTEIWAVNIPDASVAIFDATNPSQLGTTPTIVKVGLGPVAIRRRPPVSDVPVPTEMWIAAQSSNAVFIVDETTKKVTDSIRLKDKPVNVIFNDDGTEAWVILGTSEQVVHVDAVNRVELGRLEYASDVPLTGADPIHAEEPRAALRDGNDLYVLSFESGNGTTAGNFDIIDPPIAQLWNAYGPNIPPPPDRDVLRFDLANPLQCTTGGVTNQLCAENALFRAGAMNFDVKLDGSGELWVTNMAFNNILEGEFQFPIAGSAVHRVTHAPPLASGQLPPFTPPASIDLNAAATSTLLANGYACAMPTEMAFDGTFDTLWIACYGSHNVAQLDVSSGQVMAELNGRAIDPVTGEEINYGVRGVLLNEAAGVLYAYSRDNRIQVYSVPAPVNAQQAPVQSLPIGFDITTARIERGRLLHIDSTRPMVTQGNCDAVGCPPQSCNTCHIDGHMDRIAWDLSDNTGDVPGAPVGRTPKGTKVTMSLRGIEETPPFHWRGDREDLGAFNPAFVGLLGGATELAANELEDFLAFIFSLSYPPNPNLADDRIYTTIARDGFDCLHQDAHDINFGLGVVQPMTCAACHHMRGGSSTNNQVNNDVTGLLADDATQLRGLFGKESDLADYSAFVGGFLANIPATGWGFGNSSFTDTVADFVNLPVFNLLTQMQRDRIVTLLDQLDTGVAPATAYAWTLNRGSSGGPEPVTTLLQGQARRGHIDLIARGWISPGPATLDIGMLYDPTTQTFGTNTTGFGPYTFGQLDAMAGAGNAVLTFMGTPVGMGYRMAIDEEMDFLADGDEAANNALVGNADSDGDGWPDGYEVRLGSDPGNATSLPPAETVAPNVVMGTPRVRFTNSSIAKVLWETDEESETRVEVRLNGVTGTPLFVQDELQMKTDHRIVVRGMHPGTAYDFTLKTKDPAGNESSFQIQNVTMDAFDFDAVLIKETKVGAQSPIGFGAPVTFKADFRIVDRNGVGVQGLEVTFDHVEWVPGSGTNSVTSRTTAVSGPGGVASLTFTSVNVQGSGAILEVHATGVADPTGPDPLYFHPLDGQFGYWAEAPLP